MREYKKLIIGIIIGGIIASSITVYAYSYFASDVKYTNDTSVADALDDLYNKVPVGTIPITTKGSQIDVSKYQYADTTGLYTADEVQSGKGTSWNTGTFTSVSGENTITIGFKPNKLVVIRHDTGGTLLYDGSNSTTQCWYMTVSAHQKENIDPTRTTFGIRNIGSNTKLYIGAADVNWTWFATK